MEERNSVEGDVPDGQLKQGLDRISYPPDFAWTGAERRGPTLSSSTSISFDGEFPVLSSRDNPCALSAACHPEATEPVLTVELQSRQGERKISAEVGCIPRTVQFEG